MTEGLASEWNRSFNGGGGATLINIFAFVVGSMRFTLSRSRSTISSSSPRRRSVGRTALDVAAGIKQRVYVDNAEMEELTRIGGRMSPGESAELQRQITCIRSRWWLWRRRSRTQESTLQLPANLLDDRSFPKIRCHFPQVFHCNRKMANCERFLFRHSKSYALVENKTMELREDENAKILTTALSVFENFYLYK